jgi:hypothetical protein
MFLAVLKVPTQHVLSSKLSKMSTQNLKYLDLYPSERREGPKGVEEAEERTEKYSSSFLNPAYI